MSNLKTLFSKDAVILELKAKTKASALKEIAKHLFEKGFITNAKDFVDALQNREKQISTGLEGGVAIPHAQSACVKKDVVLVARSKNGIE